MSHTISERVKAGLDLFLDKCPAKIKNIDINTLSIASLYKCPVGQALGSFYKRNEIGITPGEAWRYGFDIDPANAPLKQHCELDKEWKRQLTALKEERPELFTVDEQLGYEGECISDPD